MANSLILAKAQNAVTSHDWTTASRLYKELLRGDESNVSYIEQLGSIYVRAGQDEKAIPFYEKIIELNTSNTAAMVSLGGIYRRLKRYDESVEILHKAQEISNNVSVNYNLGFTYKEMGDYDDAIDSFETVIEQNPDDVLAHNHLGSIYYALKDYEKSISAFKRGLQVDRNHPILNYNLAHSYEDLKNYPDAVRCYEIALKTRPGWVDAIRDFSELLIKCQNTKQAQELVEQSIKLHPNDVELLYILGRIYLNQFDYDNATQTFTKAESLKQNDIKILVGLAKSLEKGKKIDEAMEKITEAATIAPDDLEVCKQYAHVLLSAQRYEKALELIKKIDEKSGGKDLQILDLYGQYFVCRGDEEAANTYFEQINKINPNYKDFMINAADRYVQTGNYDKAEVLAKNYIQCRPQFGEGYNILGTVQNARGELTKAKNEYEKGVRLKNPNIYAVKELEKIYDQLQKNKEMFDDEEAPIAIDAEAIEENDADAVVSNEDMKNLLDPEKGDVEYTGMEGVSPLDDTGEFWEDFADDPDAENKALADEEDNYDENSEDENFMSYMTPDAGEAESLQDGLLQDDDEFDFGDFEDATENAPEAEATPTTEENAPAAKESEEPQVMQSEPQTAAEPQKVPAEEPVENSVPETVTEPASEPAADTVIEPEPEPAFEPAVEQPAEPEAAPVAEPSVEPEYPSDDEDDFSFDDAFEKSITDSNNDFSNELEKADKMMKDLKHQQRELELQQREFELQQRELADELRHENKRMIEEQVDRAVDKAVDKAVDEAVDKAVDKKLQEYDLPEAKQEIEPEPVIVEAAPEPESEVVIEPETEEVVEAEAEAEIEEYTDYPFISVEDFMLMAGGHVVMDSEENEEPAEEADNSIAENEDDYFITADDMLDKIERILNDNTAASEYAQEIELFKKLKILTNALPDSEKNTSSACRVRMMIDYIIAKMSGKPGLLVTAESLLKSGVLGKEYDSQLTAKTEEELSNSLIKHVLMDMKRLAKGLPDTELSDALCVTADSILEKISLIDQKSAIF